jgi:hypothetical protein
MTTKTAVIVEAGAKRTFASAAAWPGWARSGRAEEEAVEALATYRDRYVAAIRQDVGDPIFEVIERLEGDASTDMGTPGASGAVDAEPLTDDELCRQVSVLEACWSAFDRTVQRAGGRTLRPGPRGGGRDLEKIRSHVLEADGAYQTAVAGPSKVKDRGTFVEALWTRHRGELPDSGPRGGRRWTARYAIRRAAWHALDHAWEIEDRLVAIIEP